MIHKGTRKTGKLRATVWLMKLMGTFDNPNYNGPSMEELEAMSDTDFKDWLNGSCRGLKK